MASKKALPAGTVGGDLQRKRTPKPSEPKAPAAARISKVRATGAGTSRLQTGSIRAAVLSHIPKTKAGITVEALDEACGLNSRPHLQKLLEKSHIEVL